MADNKKEFREYLREEVERVRGTYYPVRARLSARLYIKKASVRSLHPNPDDEFCKPEIGPNYSIISKYEQDFRNVQNYAYGSIEKIMVQKCRPDGYLIMNGHHRWAAAYRMAVPKVDIKIVNLTQGRDIRKMLLRSRSDKRVTLDLDEVVFAGEGEQATEKPFGFPMNRFFRERVRLGIPALFRFLNDQGYDIWVYTSGLYSMEYIRHYFKCWNVRLTGIVTGAGKISVKKIDPDGELRKLGESRYKNTVHIDRNLVILTRTGTRECDEFPLDESSGNWARDVMDVFGKIRLEENRKGRE